MGDPLLVDGRTLALTRRVVEVAGIPVVVRTGEQDEGPATILLHGAAGSWTTWTPLLQAAERQGAPLANLVIPDLPGWGETPSAGGSVREVADLGDLVAGIAEALGFASWTVAGHSLGGFLALDLAARRPDETV
ncbi:MAG TPA: alpha/beta fold hydrolase, partial [Naasia sp.]